MWQKFTALTMLMAIMTAGCTVATEKPDVPPQGDVESQPVNDHRRVQPPETPHNGVRVAEQSLPTELAAWKDCTPDLPGGLSAVVGDSLYILASPGRIGDDAHTFKISDVRVLEERVEVEAYLVQTKADIKQGKFYPRDYVKTAYMGTKRELPVVLKIIYGDPAYAYVAEGSFDHVDRHLLPSALQDWQNLTGATGAIGQATVVGDFLYLMVNTDERLRECRIRFESVSLSGNQVKVVVTYEKMETQQDWQPYAAPIFARIPYQGSDLSVVEVEYKEYHRPQ